MQNYKCYNCEEIMGIECTHDIDHCPCCGMLNGLSLTDEPLPEDTHKVENWTHDGYDGCGATYTVITASIVEYCPNCNRQWG